MTRTEDAPLTMCPRCLQMDWSTLHREMHPDCNGGVDGVPCQWVERAEEVR
jgi:hypothetical protein